ncbi:MAG TPA: hypothetical protein VMF31_02380 [Solirubrobacterales bacterium]|nr:hypothetical protein [Solirubrobacterales bacterium]
MERIRTLVRRTGGVAIIAIAILAVPSAGMAKPVESNGVLSHLYNSRYCEFLLVKQIAPSISVDVFNTVGLNECPPDRFEAANPAVIAASSGSLVAAKNGPSRWTLDGILSAPEGEPADLDGLETRLIGTLSPSSLAPPPFAEIPISRSVVWNYRRGRTVRMLISPTGKKYAMQSYSRAAGSTLKESDLNGLGSNPGTKIPDGWEFRTKKVKRKWLTMRTRGAPYIVRDGFGNVYQRFNWPRPK